MGLIRNWPVRMKAGQTRSIDLTELSRSDTINLIADAVCAGLEFRIAAHPTDREQIELRMWKE